jgi:hypothetical protein
MAWITPQLVQGSTTGFPGGLAYVVFPTNVFGGGAMTQFDVISAGPEVGSSFVRIANHFAFPGPAHVVFIESNGPVTFRIRGGLQV